MNTLGDRLYYARKIRGYTQISLADAIGVSRGVIINLEKNKTEPQVIVTNAVCQVLQIREEWLLFGGGEMEDLSEDAQKARILAELCKELQELSKAELLYLKDTVKALKRRLGRRAEGK